MIAQFGRYLAVRHEIAASPLLKELHSPELKELLAKYGFPQHLGFSEARYTFTPNCNCARITVTETISPEDTLQYSFKLLEQETGAVIFSIPVKLKKAEVIIYLDYYMSLFKTNYQEAIKKGG